MSRDVFSKNKEKRARTSSGESNNSFVKNVTSRVSGLLPATISKWFSSPSSNANGSAPAADATDSEDEELGSPITTQPPAKRMRFSVPSYVTEGNCVTNNIETIETTTVRHETSLYTVQSPPGRTTFRRETNFVSTPLRSPEESAINRTEKDTSIKFPQHRVSTVAPSLAKKRKTLFGDQLQEISEATKKAYVKSSNNVTKDPKQPSFKPALLGSPFYAGRTTYGGAASSYINQPNITQRQNTTVKESTTSSNNNISHSARRVMELLESYSSPLMEAKRIPQYTRPTRQEMIKRISETSVSPYSKSNSYKTQELHLPSVASILRLKQRSRLNDTTNAARQIIASHSSSSPDYLPYPSSSKSDQSETDNNSNKLTTKVKSRLTRPHRGDAKLIDTETMPPLELPKAVLQINHNNLPNFNTPIPTKTKSSIETPPLSVIRFEPKSAKPVEFISKETISSDSIYNFANPVRITRESLKTTATPKFTFGSPERSIDSKLVSEDKNSEPIVLDTKKDESKPAGNWNCPDCWVSNKAEADKCVCCGHVKAAKAAAKPKCSLCKVTDCQSGKDKCVNCEKVQMNNIAKPLKAVQTSKWQCKDCWVDNNETAEKCVCCGASNPKSTKPAATVIKKPEASAAGMCPKCFGLTNFGKCSKCADLDSKPTNNLDNVIKAQANKWECEHCLVRNDSDKTKCVCCDADRSGAVKEPVKKQFNFGTMNTSFKFGIDPKVQEANIAKAAEKPVENKEKVEESETNNNVLAKAPTFSFGLPAKKAEDKTDTPKVAEDAPKPTFTFGLPKQNSIPSVPAPVPTFGVPEKSTESKDKVDNKDQPQGTKKSEETTKQVMFSATTPASSTSQPSVITTFAAKKDSNPLLPTISANASLNFSPKEGLFGITTTPATSTTISFTAVTTPSSANMFQKTEAPKISLFQSPKSDTPTTATVSLFQKSDAPSVSALPPAATAPIFSFGGGQTAQPAPEKPKFNFTFGNNSKPDAFKPPSFGAPTDSAKVNKFTLGNATENPLVNPLATGNSLTANSLVSGNGLSINPLANNALTPGNGLQATSNIFGAVQKESMWSSNTAANPFVANATTNSAPKPFAFGSSTPFNSNSPALASTLSSATPAFGSNIQATSTFGNAPQAFGANVQSSPTPNIFGMPNQNQSLFSSPTPNATMFGSPQQQPAMQPAMGMFGRPSVGATPTFGTPNPSIPTFEAASLTPAQAPAFNFVTPQPTGMFGFGQQQQQQPPQSQGLGSGQTGVYSFGAAAAPSNAGVQFSMGVAPDAGQRRIRKARRSQR